MSDKKVDVLAISETCLNSSISNTELKYKVTKFTDWTGNAREEEVYVFIRNNLKSKVLNDLSYIRDSGLHQLWVQIQRNKNKSIIVCVTYKPIVTGCYNDYAPFQS